MGNEVLPSLLLGGLREFGMINVEFRFGDLQPHEQAVVTQGFARHSKELSAPPFEKKRLSWIARNADVVVGVLTADALWDWLYVDKLWVDEGQRGSGLGRRLMKVAEDHVKASGLTGIWLWTQSWQAADFYQQLGYLEFTRFENFPVGHSRIGFRKQL